VSAVATIQRADNDRAFQGTLSRLGQVGGERQADRFEDVPDGGRQKVLE